MASYNDDISFGEALAKLKPAVRLTIPPGWFFKLPPSEVPRTLPPPPDHPTLAHPFSIPTNIYNKALDPVIPVTIALVYITVVTFLNSVNRSRKNRPWAFSKTRFFHLMVITHNTLLAIYSAWTFIGMLNALSNSIYSPRESHGLAGTVDSFCKINGPRGVGSAARYNAQTSSWGIANRVYHLGTDTNPDATDVGRLWNEGLAFYGWLFYISKFYEVIDTLIIIAKGKKSSFLQTYHHAGAMLCMWAGIRYMSPPIWMFVFVNSFIHAIMYSFYLCSALHIRVPVWFKRSLTTLQITQFVIGATFAFLHLFVKYQSPISTPYSYHLGEAATSVISTVSSRASTALSTSSALASADVGAQIKKILLRAAGREGLAENVLNDAGRPFGMDAVRAAQDNARREEIRYREELDWVHCLDTSGQAFAVYLNVLYLAPLTWLFIRFFIKSYLNRLERRRSSTASQKANAAYLSVRDASRGASRRLSQAFEDTQGGADTDDEFAIVDDEEFKKEIQHAADNTKRAASDAAEKTSQTAKSTAKSAKQTAKNVKKEVENSHVTQRASEKVNSSAKNIQQTASNVKREVQESSVSESVSQTVENFSSTVTDTANNVIEQVKDATSGNAEGRSAALDELKQIADSLKVQAEHASQAAKDKAEEAWQAVRNAISNVSNSEDAQQVKERATEAAQDVTTKAKDTAENAGGKAKETAADVKRAIGTDGSSDKPDSSEQKDTSTSESQSSSKNADNDVTEQEQGTEKSSYADVAKQEPGNEGQEPAENKQEPSAKEQVRKEDSADKTNTEVSTGDEKEAGASSNKSETKDVASEGTTPSKKSKKKGRNVKNSGIKDGQRQVSKQEEQPRVEEAETKKEAAGEFLNKDSGDAIEENPDGRQEFFHQEREEALQKLESINSGDQPAVLEDNEAKKEVPHQKEEEQAEEETKNTDPDEAKAAFDKTHDEALEKLKSITSEDKSSDPLHDADEHEEQKESWIQVEPGSEVKEGTSFADAVKSGEDNSKSAEDKPQEEDELWFERLNKDRDSPRSSKQSVQSSKSTKSKSSKKDDEAKEEQDKIIDESEPVRDEVKDQKEDEADAGSRPRTPNTPDTPSKWHKRRRG